MLATAGRSSGEPAKTSAVVTAPPACARRASSALRPRSIASIRPTPPRCTTRASITDGIRSSSTKNCPVAPFMWRAGRWPSGRVVTMDEEVRQPGRRCIAAVSTPNWPRRWSTQSPIMSSPTPPTARADRPILAAAITAVPAAPDTASVRSWMKCVPPPSGMAVTGQPRQSKVMKPMDE